MFELEEESEREHRGIGRLLKELKFDQIYLCGKMMLWAKEECDSAMHFEQKSDLIESLKKDPINNSTILIKASRGIGLETLVEAL